MVVGAAGSRSPLCPVRKQGIRKACTQLSCAIWGLSLRNEWYCILHFSQSSNSSLECPKVCLLGDSRFCQVDSQYLLVFSECYLHGSRQYRYTLQFLVTRNLVRVCSVYIKTMPLKPGVVVHAYNPSTWEVEASRSGSSPTSATYWVQGQTWLHKTMF